MTEVLLVLLTFLTMVSIGLRLIPSLMVASYYAVCAWRVEKWAGVR